MPSSVYSIVEFFGGDEEDASGHSCGYCKNDGSISTGMWAHSLTVQDYQDLIDRGWRRSGCYLYKPTMSSTCCPAYTIKCDALKFQLSKSQKKVMKRFNKYLVEGVSGEKEICKIEPNDDTNKEACTDLPDMTERAQGKVSDVGGTIQNDVTCDHPTKSNASAKENVKGNCSSPSKGSEATDSKADSDDLGSRRPCKKAKFMRKERRMERLLQKGLNPEEVNSKHVQEVKSLEQHLQAPVNAKHKLELRLVQSQPPSEEYKLTEEASYNVYKKYQVAVHDDPPEKVTLKQFTRFLVNSPLEPEDGENGLQLGSFHQQYWWDGKLIAVAVIDILPYCVSSVYFYYDPDYRHLTLGTYAALRELALTRELNMKDPDLAFYYMGFYIHSCPKMRYKGQYNPSFLLCPVSYTWHPIEKCKPLLDKSKYSEFDKQHAEKAVCDDDLKSALVLHRRMPMTFSSYVSRSRFLKDEELKELKFYIHLVGIKVASRMLLYRA